MATADSGDCLAEGTRQLMSDTPIYQQVADAQGFDPSKMETLIAKLASFEGLKKRSKRDPRNGK